MFDLESAIGQWRQQMRAAGIQSPALEELESHLREEVEQQLRAQTDEAATFRAAVAAMGQPGELKQEFRRAGGWLGWLGDNETARIHRVLGVLWLGYCLRESIALTLVLSTIFSYHIDKKGVFFLLIFAKTVYLLGLFASGLLLAGKTKMIPIIKLVAILGLIGMAAQIVIFQLVTPTAILLTVFNIATLWLLRNRTPNQNHPVAS